MKKLFAGVLVCVLIVLTLALCACGDDKNGTYFPPNDEMKTNLENNGYAVTLYQDISDNNGNRHYGTLIFASKHRDGEQEEYLYFYRFDNAVSCEEFHNYLEQNCKGYNSLVMLQNDEKFGNIVYCGTENAVTAAGIKVVKVEVKI